MAENASDGQFCPVSMAAKVLCTRWTVLVLREFLCGSTRFNELRRGVPRMSPALLSKRLKELESAGVIAADTNVKGVPEYRLTEAGEDLRPLVMSLGNWGQKWIESRLSLRNLDPSLLMWDIRRNIDPRPLPPRKCTIQFQYPDVPEVQRNWWLVVEHGETDLCSVDPGFEVDLLVRGSLRSMTAVWMGLSDLRSEVGSGRLKVDGDPKIARAMEKWLALSPFARTERRVA